MRDFAQLGGCREQGRLDREDLTGESWVRHAGSAVCASCGSAAGGFPEMGMLNWKALGRGPWRLPRRQVGGCYRPGGDNSRLVCAGVHGPCHTRVLRAFFTVQRGPGRLLGGCKCRT